MKDFYPTQSNDFVTASQAPVKFSVLRCHILIKRFLRCGNLVTRERRSTAADLQPACLRVARRRQVE